VLGKMTFRAVLLLAVTSTGGGATGAEATPFRADVTPRRLRIFAFDEWPIYNGSATDYTHWDWKLMAGQYVALPYGPWTAAGQGNLYAQAAAAGVQLMHENHAVYTEALMPHLANLAMGRRFIKCRPSSARARSLIVTPITVYIFALRPVARRTAPLAPRGSPQRPPLCCARTYLQASHGRSSHSVSTSIGTCSITAMIGAYISLSTFKNMRRVVGGHF
jgi:hypothetical protein